MLAGVDGQLAEGQAPPRQWVDAIQLDNEVLAIGVERGAVTMLWSPGQAPFRPYAPPPREWYAPPDVSAWISQVRAVIAAADRRLPARRVPLDSMPTLGQATTRHSVLPDGDG